MKLNVYTIFDQASGTYLRPFFTTADGEATRSFSDLATSADHQIGKHPKDYSLYRIGTYDDNKGKLIPETPECLCTALEMVSQAQQVRPGQLDAFDAQISPGGTD